MLLDSIMDTEWCVGLVLTMVSFAIAFLIILMFNLIGRLLNMTRKHYGFLPLKRYLILCWFSVWKSSKKIRKIKMRRVSKRKGWGLCFVLSWVPDAAFATALLLLCPVQGCWVRLLINRNLAGAPSIIIDILGIRFMCLRISGLVLPGGDRDENAKQKDDDDDEQNSLNSSDAEQGTAIG